MFAIFYLICFYCNLFFMRLRNLLQVREKLDFLMAYMGFYEMIWCALREEIYSFSY